MVLKGGGREGGKERKENEEWVEIRINKEQRRLKKGKRGHLIFSLFHNYFIILRFLTQREVVMN